MEMNCVDVPGSQLARPLHRGQCHQASARPATAWPGQSQPVARHLMVHSVICRMLCVCTSCKLMNVLCACACMCLLACNCVRSVVVSAGAVCKSVCLAFYHCVHSASLGTHRPHRERCWRVSGPGARRTSGAAEPVDNRHFHSFYTMRSRNISTVRHRGQI